MDLVKDEAIVVTTLFQRVALAREKHKTPTYAALIEEFLELAREVHDNNDRWKVEAMDCMVVLFRLLTERDTDEAKFL